MNLGPLIPAQAGIQNGNAVIANVYCWVPAFAGTSGE
jgi:hypothetical protein